MPILPVVTMTEEQIRKEQPRNRRESALAVTRYERLCCQRRESLHVWDRDRQGNYTVKVYDPIASVLSYLRDEHWFALHPRDGRVNDSEVSGLVSAMELVNDIANGRK